MDRMIYLSMAGAKMNMQRQDVLSNNLANVSTTGFRAELQATRAVPVRNERDEIIRWYGSTVDIETQRETLERSQRVAETLQRVFLPGHLPHTPSMRVDAVYKAAESDALIGGDWLDAVELPDGRYLFSIGDVTGHGLDASVIAGRLRHAIVDFVKAHGLETP